MLIEIVCGGQSAYLLDQKEDFLNRRKKFKKTKHNFRNGGKGMKREHSLCGRFFLIVNLLIPHQARALEPGCAILFGDSENKFLGIVC